MYSINPVSRLTAIEYYLKNKQRFTNTKRIGKWIAKVFGEVPTIETIYGCLVTNENSKLLVEKFAKAKFD